MIIVLIKAVVDFPVALAEAIKPKHSPMPAIKQRSAVQSIFFYLH